MGFKGFDFIDKIQNVYLVKSILRDDDINIFITNNPICLCNGRSLVKRYSLLFIEILFNFFPIFTADRINNKYFEFQLYLLYTISLSLEHILQNYINNMPIWHKKI